MQSQKSYPKTFSFEFFPPRNAESAARLWTTAGKLAELQPDYCSVTFGAGGSTRDRTFETVMELRKRFGLEVVPHVSCVGSSIEEIRALLQKYKDNGLKHLVALRGDMPSGTSGFGELRYANELVHFIREEFGDYFTVEVAAYPEMHPQAPSMSRDIANFQRKVEAGADAAITQYFYNVDAYLSFVDACEERGIDIAITPGVMPIINCAQLVRFSEACGAEIRRWILKRLQEYGDDRASIRRFGTEVTIGLCRQLLEAGAPGLHFYTLNQAEACLDIWDELDLSARRKAAA